MNNSDFYDCTEEIAKVLDKHLPRPIEDGDGVDLINKMVLAQVDLARKLQEKENVEINGGSK